MSVSNLFPASSRTSRKGLTHTQFRNALKIWETKRENSVGHGNISNTVWQINIKNILGGSRARLMKTLLNASNAGREDYENMMMLMSSKIASLFSLSLSAAPQKSSDILFKLWQRRQNFYHRKTRFYYNSSLLAAPQDTLFSRAARCSSSPLRGHGRCERNFLRRGFVMLLAFFALKWLRLQLPYMCNYHTHRGAAGLHC